MSEPISIRYAPDAVAASKCYLARVSELAVASHPRPCAWCEVPADALIAAVRDFLAWDEMNEQRESGGFRRLSRAAQAAAVLESQGYVEQGATA